MRLLNWELIATRIISVPATSPSVHSRRILKPGAPTSRRSTSAIPEISATPVCARQRTCRVCFFIALPSARDWQVRALSRRADYILISAQSLPPSVSRVLPLFATQLLSWTFAAGNFTSPGLGLLRISTSRHKTVVMHQHGEMCTKLTAYPLFVPVAPPLQLALPCNTTCFSATPLRTIRPSFYKNYRCGLRSGLRTFSTSKRHRCGSAPTCTFNDNRNRNYKVADVLIATGRFLQSPSGQVLLWGTLVWLVLTGRIGIIFDSFLILFAVLTVVPVVAILGFRWWIGRQLVRGTCSSCGATVTGLKGQSVNCAVCGTVFQTEKTGDFSVKDPSSATIDIDAREVD